MAKKLRDFIFHSKELMPYSISRMPLEDRVHWEETSRKDHRFKKDDEVVHVDNTETVLHVKQIIKQSASVDTGIIGEDNLPVMQRVKRMMGVQCYWWE